MDLLQEDPVKPEKPSVLTKQGKKLELQPQAGYDAAEQGDLPLDRRIQKDLPDRAAGEQEEHRAGLLPAAPVG
ncbi:MAG: hypothetical protein LBF75_12285 [Treponema sp.]|nr:hypothetical protein [Treponema sp.]